MRVNEVKHSLTALTCGKCRDDIKPSRDEKQVVEDKRTGKKVKKVVRVLGDPYRWIKHNRRPRKVRCMKPECRFHRSDMTTSDKLSRAYAAEETAETSIAGWGGLDASVDDLKEILTTLADEAREIAEEYNESAENIENAFPNGSATAEECREKAEELEGWADELEAIDFEEWDGPDVGEADEEKKAAAEQEFRDEEAGIKKGPSDREASAGPEEPKNTSGETHEEWIEAQRELANDAIGCPI